MNISQKIAKFVDGTTMYKMVIGGLASLALFSLVLSLFDYVPFSIGALLASYVTVFVVSLSLNTLLAKAFKAPLNHEPAIITALILFFLIAPSLTLSHLIVISIASIAAILSKYLLVYGKRHILNPAAVGVVVVGLLHLNEPVWWIGSTFFLFPMIIVGGLVVYKIRRFALVGSFLLVSFVTFALEGFKFNDSVFESLGTFLFSWPVLFLGTIMLTEPLTTPPTKKLQIVYGALIGFLVNTSVFSGLFAMTPELALLIGNIVAFPFLLKKRLILMLLEKKEIARDTFEFIFEKPKDFVFQAGQYLEWTVPHKKIDKRGVRRYFTLASAPTEDTVRLGVKISKDGSSFKKELQNMREGDVIYGTQLSGDFVLPSEKRKPCVFIAGGIGITPFRSMIQQMIDEKNERQMTLLYANRTPEDIAYSSLFESAEQFGLKTVHVISENETAREGDETGFIDKDMLERYVSDTKNSMYYLSGPHAMVVAYKKMLRGVGVPKKNIKTDYFPGLA